MRDETLRALRELNEALVSVAAMVRADTEAVVGTQNHLDVIRHYSHVRKATNEIKESREALAGIEENLSREVVPDLMRANKVKTVNLEGVGRVTVSYRYSASMLDRPQGINWLKENGHGGIVQETVHSQTLSSFAKNLMETDGVELPAEIFKVGTSPFTSITKA